MYFATKSYLKSNRNHTAKQMKTSKQQWSGWSRLERCLGQVCSVAHFNSLSLVAVV
jgi:hypothetical protein